MLDLLKIIQSFITSMIELVKTGYEQKGSATKIRLASVSESGGAASGACASVVGARGCAASRARESQMGPVQICLLTLQMKQYAP